MHFSFFLFCPIFNQIFDRRSQKNTAHLIGSRYHSNSVYIIALDLPSWNQAESVRKYRKDIIALRSVSKDASHDSAFLVFNIERLPYLTLNDPRNLERIVNLIPRPALCYLILPARGSKSH